jgi:hypothetical protein
VVVVVVCGGDEKITVVAHVGQSFYYNANLKKSMSTTVA